MNTEVIEQARLLGMGSEREAKLIAQLAAKDAIIQDLHKQLGVTEKRRDTYFRMCNRLLSREAALREQLREQRRDEQPLRGQNLFTLDSSESRAVSVAASLTADYWQSGRLGYPMPSGEPVEPRAEKPRWMPLV